MHRLICLLALTICLAGPARAEVLETSQGPLRVERMLGGLDEPWALAFLPGDGFLVTERDSGRLLLARGGRVRAVLGMPAVRAVGQGGLLDVLVPRDFATSGEILFTYVRRAGGRAVTVLGRGQLDVDAARLRDVRDLFEMVSPSGGGRHFGSRIVEARDGTLFVTLGERGDPDEAQNLANHNGTVVRLARDGTVPPDNPFAGRAGARPEIYSYGHRNPQGAAMDLRGRIWVVEHGAKGGDEVNLLAPGANYGWPVIAYGRHYSGAPIGEGTHKPGMEQPAHYWDPSIAPSGLMIYSGKLWPAWRGHVFTGSLKFDYLSRLDPARGWAEERIAGPQTARVRDVREAPDGSIWFISVGQGAVYRLSR